MDVAKRPRTMTFEPEGLAWKFGSGPLRWAVPRRAERSCQKHSQPQGHRRVRKRELGGVGLLMEK